MIYLKVTHPMCSMYYTIVINGYFRELMDCTYQLSFFQKTLGLTS
jgi:hypothetical protein